jgi:hypothetical protein
MLIHEKELRKTLSLSDHNDNQGTTNKQKSSRAFTENCPSGKHSFQTRGKGHGNKHKDEMLTVLGQNRKGKVRQRTDKRNSGLFSRYYW